MPHTDDAMVLMQAAEEEYIEKKRFYESKVEAKEEFIEKKRQEAAAIRQALFEEARLKEEYARRRLELKVSPVLKAAILSCSLKSFCNLFCGS